MSENFRIALISATAAIAGGIVTGVFSYGATVKTQNSANKRAEGALVAADQRAEKRIEQRARGAGRALIYELRDSTAEFDLILNEGHYRPLDSRFPVHLSQADMELVISRISEKQYDDLSRALSGIDTLYRYLKFQHPGRTRGIASILSPFERKSVHEYAVEGVRAMNDLARVADVTNPGKYFSPPPARRH